MNYNDNGTVKQITVKAGDTLPVGTEVDFNGNTIPAGWEEVDNPNNYSETETKIGTWIDGKPLYRKVVTGDIATTSKTLASIASMDKLISLTGMLNVPSGYKTNIPEYTNSTNFCALVLDTQNRPLITIPSNFANSTFVIIEEYTKTTD